MTEIQKKEVKDERAKNSKNIVKVLNNYKTDLKKLFEELGENNEFKELYTLNNNKLTLKLEKGTETQLEDLMDLLEKKIDDDEEEKAIKISDKQIKKLEKKYGKDTPKFKEELKKLQNKKKQKYLYEKLSKQQKTNHAVTALKRYMQSNKKLGKSSYPGDPPPLKVKGKLSEKDLLDIKKKEEADELLKFIGGIYGYESSEYNEVLSYVLNPNSDKRTELNKVLNKVSQIKPEGLQQKKRFEKLLNKYDDFLKTLQDPDEYNKIFEEMSNRASMKLLGKTKIEIEPEEITPSSGFFKKLGSFLSNSSKSNKLMYLIPIITNLSEMTGVTIMKLIGFFSNMGIDIFKYINKPRKWKKFKTLKSMKRNQYFYKYKRSLIDRYNTTFKKDNKKLDEKSYTDAKKILRSLYQQGYRDALMKLKDKKKGGYHTRKKKNKNKNKYKKHRKRFTFRNK